MKDTMKLFKKFQTWRIVNNRFISSRRILGPKKEVHLPQVADVVIIGGGSAGCNTLYQFAKKGVQAVLLERAKLTSGTTWHTAGLTRGLQPSDVEIALLNRTVDVVKNLKNETGIDPGWINNGGLYIAHCEEKEKDYLRQITLGKYFNIKSEILDSKDVMKIFPLLDSKTYRSALYCPEDGVVDPAMLCNALIKGAKNNGGKVFEECPVIYVQTEQTKSGRPSITGVVTPHGIVQTKCVVNCTGVWARDLTHMLDLELPLVPMKHAYVVSNSINGIRGMPNVRDLEASIYMRIQGESICLGGYESNPDILKEVASDFQFGLYDLNWDTFDEHVTGAVRLCPAFGKAGIKTTICGPESFTPDHKPIMGEDPRINGLFHNCAFNSAGMMLGGGCAEQIALWVMNGRPELPMYAFDIRRFTPKMMKTKSWLTEKSHEGFAKYYSTRYPLDESLGGRNLEQSPFYMEMVSKGAFMEQKLGWERPRYFRKNGAVIVPEPYRWYGAYGYSKRKSKYEKELDDECQFSFPKSQDLVRDEALACRNNAVLFDLSYYCKLYLSGKDARKAVDWMFSGKIDSELNKTVYTCGLNESGGVETDVTITKFSDFPFNKLEQGSKGFYIVAGGASAYNTWVHLSHNLEKANFDVELSDITKDVGVLSIQGPKSKQIVQILDPTSIDLPLYHTKKIHIDGLDCLLMRISFVGELGYELHIPNKYCLPIYQKIVETGHRFGLKHAGFRALYSLSCEKGYHLWDIDLRANDSPLEANLGFTCRKNGNYIGKTAVDQLRKSGIQKQIAYFTMKCDQPLWGLETIWRNGEVVGFLRRGDYAFSLDCNIGVGYIQHPNKKIITDNYLLSGNYELEIMGKKYPTQIHKKSPFDPKNKRML